MKHAALQDALGYQFKSTRLLQQALTHRSYGSPHNERLEFLGDGVLNCIIAAELYGRFAALREGELSRLRASLVREQRLHEIATRLCLGRELRLGEGELKSGGFRRPSILADALEALVGAVFLDGGYEAAHQVVTRLYRPTLDTLDSSGAEKDPKTQLQEWLQSRRYSLPEYHIVATHGAAHDQRFEVECLIRELAVRTLGTGASRRTAEQEAARAAFERLRE